MTQEKSNSTWTWFLPLMAGAVLTLVSNQLSQRFQENEHHRDAHIDQMEHLFHEVSTLTGELYYVTRNLIGELEKEHSNELDDLEKEYDDLLVKLNTNYLRDLSILEFYIDEKYAERFGQEIIAPLMHFNPIIEDGLDEGTPVKDFKKTMSDLDKIREVIIDFNKDFINLIEDLRKDRQ